jgi:thiamine biosynthesis protein ThiS
MQLTVNGQPTQLEDAATVSSMLEKLGYKGRAVAVEINLKVVPKKQHAQTQVKEGDTVEIVTLVGGG